MSEQVGNEDKMRTSWKPMPNRANLFGIMFNLSVEFIEQTKLAEFWCPYCGGWHGSSPPAFTESRIESGPAPELPQVLGKVIGKVIEAETNMRRKPLAESWQQEGSIDGEPAKVKQSGDRIRVIWDGNSDIDPYNHKEIISNDGVNAVYVRDLNENVVVDNSKDEPYTPYVRDTSNRITFE